METIELEVNGMTCDSCVASVTRALQRVPGVGAVDVDLQRGIARVTAAGVVPVPTVVKALAAAGYEATPLSAAAGSGTPSGQVKQATKGCGHGQASKQSGCCCSH